MPKMSVEFDNENEIITIEGVRFTYDFFRTLGMDGPPVGTVLRIEQRDDGSISLSKHTPPFTGLFEQKAAA